MLTETWINSNQDLWKDTTILNRNQLRLHRADQKQDKGGRLALIHKLQYPVKCIKSGHKHFSKFTTWELMIKNTIQTIHGIYHLPYSLTNKITNTMFIEDFMNFVSTNLPVYQNNVFIGNFNLHVSNALDTDSAIFNDSIDTMGMYQHGGFTTHKSGNVLDLILSDITDNTKVLTTALQSLCH